jgi:hypothetical protein
MKLLAKPRRVNLFKGWTLALYRTVRKRGGTHLLRSLRVTLGNGDARPFVLKRGVRYGD